MSSPRNRKSRFSGGSSSNNKRDNNTSTMMSAPEAAGPSPTPNSNKATVTSSRRQQSLHYNHNTNFSMNQLGNDIDAMDKNRVENKREKRGECRYCGTKLYKIGLLGKKQKALTVDGKVLNGRCLNCHPLQYDPQQQHQLQQQQQQQQHNMNMIFPISEGDGGHNSDTSPRRQKKKGPPQQEFGGFATSLPEQPAGNFLLRDQAAVAMGSDFVMPTEDEAAIMTPQHHHQGGGGPLPPLPPTPHFSSVRQPSSRRIAVPRVLTCERKILMPAGMGDLYANDNSDDDDDDDDGNCTVMSGITLDHGLTTMAGDNYRGGAGGNGEYYDEDGQHIIDTDEYPPSSSTNRPEPSVCADDDELDMRPELPRRQQQHQHQQQQQLDDSDTDRLVEENDAEETEGPSSSSGVAAVASALAEEEQNQSRNEEATPMITPGQLSERQREKKQRQQPSPDFPISPQPSSTDDGDQQAVAADGSSSSDRAHRTGESKSSSTSSDLVPGAVPTTNKSSLETCMTYSSSTSDYRYQHEGVSQQQDADQEGGDKRTRFHSGRDVGATVVDYVDDGDDEEEEAKTEIEAPNYPSFSPQSNRMILPLSPVRIGQIERLDSALTTDDAIAYNETGGESNRGLMPRLVNTRDASRQQEIYFDSSKRDLMDGHHRDDSKTDSVEEEKSHQQQQQQQQLDHHHDAQNSNAEARPDENAERKSSPKLKGALKKLSPLRLRKPFSSTDESLGNTKKKPPDAATSPLNKIAPFFGKTTESSGVGRDTGDAVDTSEGDTSTMLSAVVDLVGPAGAKPAPESAPTPAPSSNGSSSGVYPSVKQVSVQRLLQDIESEQVEAADRFSALRTLASLIWEFGDTVKRKFSDHNGIDALVAAMWMDMSNAKILQATTQVMLAMVASTDEKTDATDNAMFGESYGSAIDTLLIALQTHLSRERIQQAGCQIFNCLASATVEVPDVNDGTEAGAVVTVLRAMNAHPTSSTVQETGIRALYSQCVFSKNAQRNIRTLTSSSLDDGIGGYDVLLRALKCNATDAVATERALMLYWHLTSDEEDTDGTRSHTPELVEKILSALYSFREREDAITLLEAGLGVVASLSSIHGCSQLISDPFGAFLLTLEIVQLHQNQTGICIECCLLLAELAPLVRNNEFDTEANGAVHAVVRALNAMLENVLLVEAALRALVALSVGSSVGKTILCGQPVFSNILIICQQHEHSATCQERACQLLSSVCTCELFGENSLAQEAVDMASLSMSRHTTVEEVQAAACTCLRNLSCVDENIAFFRRGDIAGLVLDAMTKFKESNPIQLNACYVLWNMALNGEKEAVVAYEKEAIEAIVASLRNHLEDADLLDVACGALWGLICGSTELKHQLIEVDGGIDAVICAMVMHQDVPSLLEKACGVLSSLSADERLADSLRTAQGVSSIVDVVRNNASSVRVLQYGTLFLTNMILAVPEAAVEAAGTLSVVMQALTAHTDAMDFQREACNFIWAIAASSQDSKSKILALDGIAVLLGTLEYSGSSSDVQDAALGAFTEICLNAPPDTAIEQY